MKSKYIIERIEENGTIYGSWMYNTWNEAYKTMENLTKYYISLGHKGFKMELGEYEKK